MIRIDTLKGIVIAGNRREYRDWLRRTGDCSDEYTLITDADQLLSLRGTGLPCYLIGSYRESNFYTGEVENIIRSRGFRLTWE